MRAIVLKEYGGPEVLKVREIPDPEPGAGEVRVDIHAASLNRADVLERMGKYPPPGPAPEHEIPGLDFSGTVERTGAGVVGWKAGDRVFGLLTFGGYAERVVVHERMLMRIPDGMSFVEAAAVPEAYFTAWDALAERVGLRTGETALVHAAASGVGVATVQLARFLGARLVFGTTRSPGKAERLREIGADRAIVTGGEDFAQVVLDETRGHGADVIVDFGGGGYLDANLRAAATEGRLVFVSYLAGSEARVPIPELMRRRLRIAGTSLRNRAPERKRELTERFVREVLPGFADGRLRPLIDRTFRLEEAPEAHRAMERNIVFGKVVLVVR